jgi:hypothetical protein
VFSNRISQALHEDHCASALMERRDGLIAASRKQSPGTTASATARLLPELAGAVEAEADRHVS